MSRRLIFDFRAALAMAKTGRENQDAIVEHKVGFSPDGKALVVEFSRYSGKPQLEILDKLIGR